MPDITVSSDIHSFMQSATDAAARTDLGLGEADAVTHDTITLTTEATAPEFVGELRGAVIFQAQAGEVLIKGDVVYVSGISGNTPVVSKADNTSAATMPAFGLAHEDASLNNPVDIVTFGTLAGLDTSAWTEGDTVYVNGSGVLTNVKPTGEGSLIQNLGKVQRSHVSAGSIKVGGAGRTNDTPNLNDGNIFIGNGSNQATTSSFSGLLTTNAATIKTAYESNADTNEFSDTEQTKLAGIETSATADQTGAEIKSLYELEADTNAFTDAEKTKLTNLPSDAEANAVDSVNTQTGAVVLDADDISDASTTKKFLSQAQKNIIDSVETGATADQTGAEIKTAYEGEANTNAFTDAEKTKLSGIEDSADVNPAQVSGAEKTAGIETATRIYSPQDIHDMIDTHGQTGAAPVDSVNGATGVVVLDADDIDDTATAHRFATSTQLTKLDGIEDGATADQSDAEIKTAYENNANTNAFTDTEKTKLSNIADNAEVNVNADWNSVSGDSQILNKPTLGTAAATASTDYATAAQGALADSSVQPSDNVSTLTNDAGYLTAESDTLDAVTGRGATTTNAVTVGSITINGEIVEEATNTTSVTGAQNLDPSSGTIQRIVMSGDITYTDTLVDGESITLHIDDGAAHSITWPVAAEWVGGTEPTLDTTNETIVVLWKVNSTLYGMTSGVAS